MSNHYESNHWASNHWQSNHFAGEHVIGVTGVIAATGGRAGSDINLIGGTPQRHHGSGGLPIVKPIAKRKERKLPKAKRLPEQKTKPVISGRVAATGRPAVAAFRGGVTLPLRVSAAGGAAVARARGTVKEGRGQRAAARAARAARPAYELAPTVQDLLRSQRRAAVREQAAIALAELDAQDLQDVGDLVAIGACR